MTEVSSDEEAVACGFAGSPTVRVGGVDVVEPEQAEPVLLTCRVYRLRDGRYSPTPDRSICAPPAGAGRDGSAEPCRWPSAPSPVVLAARHGWRRDVAEGVTVVVFTCDHCPYALAWHARIQSVAREYGERGVRMLRSTATTRAAIPATRPRRWRRASRPANSRARIYATKSAGRAGWAATVTPDVFVLDAAGRVCLPRRRPTPTTETRPRTRGGCEPALEDVLAGRAVANCRPSRSAARSSGGRWPRSARGVLGAASRLIRVASSAPHDDRGVVEGT